jgi:hypothetical protein
MKLCNPTKLCGIMFVCVFTLTMLSFVGIVGVLVVLVMINKNYDIIAGKIMFWVFIAVLSSLYFSILFLLLGSFFFICKHKS